MSDQVMTDPGERTRYEGYRGLTVAVRGHEAAQVHYAGVAEWGLETGASVTSHEAAMRVARHAVDSHLDAGADPAATLRVGFAEARPMAVLGTVVPTEGGDHQVFHQAEGLSEEEDPYLARPGWYHQSLVHDEPPSGPFASYDEAAEDAVESARAPSKAP